MKSDSTKLIVSEGHCDCCGTPSVQVYHPSFPEFRLAASSAEQAAERLASRLETSLDAVSDPSRREPVRRAIADIRAFLSREGGLHPARDL